MTDGRNAVCRAPRMCRTCFIVRHMSRMIQVRNVPDNLHREVKARAARAGMSLSDYLLREIERAIEAPPVEDLLRRLETRHRPELEETPAEALRAERSKH